MSTAAVVVLSTAVAAAPAQARVSGHTNFPAALLVSLANPDADPPGANDWGCRPSAAKPVPVVLVHGTLENAYDNWNALAPALKNDGYCVFALNYGAPAGAPFKGTADIALSAKELAVHVDRVRAATGAPQVDLVGHSQGGGVLPRQYLKFEGGGGDPEDPGDNKVRKLIGITPSNHGTSVGNLGAPLIAALGPVLAPLLPRVDGPWAEQQSIGSEFIRRLDEGGDTVAGVSYTVLASRYDEVLVPYTNSFLTAGPGAEVDNTTIQDVCPSDAVDHLASSYDPVVIRLVMNALDPATAVPPRCRIVLPVVGALLPLG
jgi:triacylglycerol esterase/lipase EstA (alpha/beta hydrolase family)